MKKIAILFSLSILLSGGTTVVLPAKVEVHKINAVNQLNQISEKLDSTSSQLNHVFKNLDQ